MHRFALLLALLWASAGCGQQVDAAAVLKGSGAALAGVKTVRAQLDFSKGAVEFDSYTIQSAKTQISLPHDSDTTYVVRSGDATISLRTVITGGAVYLKIFFTGFQKLPDD